MENIAYVLAIAGVVFFALLIIGSIIKLTEAINNLTAALSATVARSKEISAEQASRPDAERVSWPRIRPH